MGFLSAKGGYTFGAVRSDSTLTEGDGEQSCADHFCCCLRSLNMSRDSRACAESNASVAICVLVNKIFGRGCLLGLGGSDQNESVKLQGMAICVMRRW